MSKERRVNKRVPIEMWVEEERQGDTYFQRSANLSVGGIYLDGTIPHPRGTVVNLRFTLPGDSEEISLKAEIVGRPDEEKLGMHARFLNLEEGSDIQKKLIAYIDEQPEN